LAAAFDHYVAAYANVTAGGHTTIGSNRRTSFHIDPSSDADDRHRPVQDGDLAQQPVALIPRELGEYLLAQHLAEQDQENAEGDAAGPRL
jgi:hypothetical protein